MPLYIYPVTLITESFRISNESPQLHFTYLLTYIYLTIFVPNTSVDYHRTEVCYLTYVPYILCYSFTLAYFITGTYLLNRSVDYHRTEHTL